ncbi:MAG: hypothetical protein A2054_00170 [Deltaproteobacteria bacterium GWA2_55_10]|nr:MAG: hypothetical protein A2054_00170 [Deltaproteobacteria bacterium GWA2_55_10]
MNQGRERVIRLGLAGAVFIAGILIGTFLWDRIVLPFENPWGIMGPLTFISFNPANNVVRFLVFVSCPLILLAAAYLFSTRRLRELFFASPRPAGPAQGKGGWAAFLFLLFFSVLLSLFHPFNFYDELDTFHEGETLGAAVSYEAGQDPYEDYISAHGVYQDPLRSVIAFKLFGRSIGAARAYEGLHDILAFTLLGLVAWRLFAGNVAFAFAALLLASVYVFVEPSWALIPPLLVWRQALTLSFILAALSLNSRMLRGELGGAGLFTAGFLFSFIPIASFLCSIDRAFYITAAFVVLLPFLYFFGFRGSRAFLASTALGVVSGAVLLVVTLQSGIDEFFEFVFLVMPRYKELMDGLVYPFGVPSAFLLCALLSLNAFWVAKRFFCDLRVHGKAAPRIFFRNHFVEVMLLIISMAAFRGALGRADLPHIAYSSYFTYLLSIYLVFTTPLVRAFFERPGLWRALNAGAIALTAAVSVFGVYKIYSGDLLRQKFPIHVSDAELIPDNYEAAISYLDANLGPGEHFFTMTNEAAWYYFLDRPSPTRFHIVWFAMPHFYQQEIIGDLEEKDVEFVIMSNSHWANKLDRISSQARLPIVRDYILENYEFHVMIDDHEIWRRKES